MKNNKPIIITFTLQFGMESRQNMSQSHKILTDSFEKVST